MDSSNSVKNSIQPFIQHIIAITANISLYGSSHPQIHNLCTKALEQLANSFRNEQKFTFKRLKNRLIINDVRCEETISNERFNHLLQDKNINFLEITAGVTQEELLAFAQHLNSRNNILSLQNAPHIEIGQLTIDKSNTQHIDKSSHDFHEVATKNCGKFMETYTNVAKSKVSAIAIGEIVDDFISSFSSHSHILSAMAPLRSMDEYVYVHSTNICLLNLAQAKLLGITGPALKDIGIAAMLHDVGKMFIPAEILNKPGRPTDEEWQLIKEHPRLGAEYLINCPGIPYLAIINAYEHHMGFDGNGYPAETTKKRNLSICSHMTTISDIYDALRTRRSYKEPMTFSRIQQIMNDSIGKSLHPQLTRSFLNAMSQVDQDPS